MPFMLGKSRPVASPIPPKLHPGPWPITDFDDPKAVDVRLIGPGGQSVVLMAGVGGTSPVSVFPFLAFDDEAAATLPADSPFGGGTYRPTGPGTLADFDTTTADGAWTLRVASASGRATINNGWELTLQTVANGPPVNAVPGAQTMLEDGVLVFSAATNNPITVSDPDAGTDPVRVTLAATAGALTLAGTANLTVSGNGTATVVLTGAVADINAALDGAHYAPPADFNGPVTVTVTTDDQGHNGPDGPKTDQDAVVVTVRDVNDPPTFTPAGDPPGSVEDGGPQTVLGFATAISAGPANEAGQALTFDVSVVATTDTLAFAAAPAVDPATGALTYQAAAGTVGTATVRVVLRDNGGTADGGLDASLARTFAISVTPAPVTAHAADASAVRPAAGSVNAVFIVTLSHPSTETVLVDYVTVNGTAVAGVDYQNAFGTLEFDPGQTSRLVVVPVLGTALADGDKTFTLALRGAAPWVLTDGPATGTVRNDLIAAAGRPLAADSGKRFSGVVGSFAATNFTRSGDFSVVIDWGDGTTSVGTVGFNADTGRWEILGTHKYGKKGTYAVQFVITNPNGKRGAATSSVLV
jgi:hypothetical protein